MISQGEVHGGNKRNLYIGAVLYAIVIITIAYYAISYGKSETFLLLLPFAWLIYRPLANAIKDPIGLNIGKAVKAGVINLILMDAAWGAALGAMWAALFIACLLPISIRFAKMFAVT
jgi:4-hydroxybenzoate polyprenyltransferase